jgi:hypothetical protein
MRMWDQRLRLAVLRLRSADLWNPQRHRPLFRRDWAQQASVRSLREEARRGEPASGRAAGTGSGGDAMKNLIEYIQSRTERGECQCGKCCDKGPDRAAPEHSVNVHFFWVSARNEPKKDELLALLKAEYPDFERLRQGPSYIEIGGALGGQGIALQLIGLGQLVGLWSAVTPEVIGMKGEDADRMAGSGFVMMSGIPLAVGQ